MSLTRQDLGSLRLRLRKAPRWYRHYGLWKVLLDPVYALVLMELAGKRDVVDLGAGMGLLEALLPSREPDARILAVEWDGRKSRIARLLTGDLPTVQVVEGDARDFELCSPDAVLLLDLLHYLAPEEQRVLLTRCAASLVPGGLLLIRDLDTGGGKAWLTRLIEHMAVAVGWNRASRVKPWPLKDMKEHLEREGLRITARHAGKGPFSGNALLVATKAPSPP